MQDLEYWKKSFSFFSCMFKYVQATHYQSMAILNNVKIHTIGINANKCWFKF